MRWLTLFISFFILRLLTACKGSEMQAGSEWLNELNNGKRNDEGYIVISQADVYEVTASKVDLALQELDQRSIFRLSPELAEWYTGHYYTCPTGKQPYLVRAVYGHAGTGAYILKNLNDDLLIIHQSLGHSTIYQKSALVVNLDYEPDQVYIHVKIAE